MSPNGQPICRRVSILITAGAVAVFAVSCGGTPFPSAATTPSTTAAMSATPARPEQTSPTTTSPELAFPTLEVTSGVNAGSSAYKPLYEIRGTGSRTSPPFALSTTCLTGGVSNDGWVKVSIAPAGKASADTTVQYYMNGAGDGGAGAKLALPGKYVVIVEANSPNVHWTVDLADQGSIYSCSPTFEVKRGVNNSESGPYKPLYEVRGVGSRTSPPLDFSTTCLIGGVDNDGWVNVSIAPAGRTSKDAAIHYYTNGGGDGGAAATLPGHGKYVVIVEAIKPNVHWTVDIADAASTNSRC